MKKIISIVSSAMFVLAMAASAFAIQAEIPSDTTAAIASGSTSITLGGDIRFRGAIINNRDLGANEAKAGSKNTDSNNVTANYDTRVRLSAKADVTKTTTGFIMLESGDAAGATDVYTWGAEKKYDTGGTYQKGNGKIGGVDILEAWILHKFDVGVGMKVGHMPLKLGNGLFFDHTKYGDDALVFFMDPTKEIHLGLLTAKFQENTTTSADDADAYVGLVTYTTKDVKGGVNVTYVNDQGAAAGGMAIHLWNFGVNGDMNFGPATVRADVEMQSGKIVLPGTAKWFSSATDTVGHSYSEVKMSGFAMLLGADYKMDPVKMTLEYAYGSGNPTEAFPDASKTKAFTTALSNAQHYTYVYDYLSKTAAGQSLSGLTNTWYVKLGGDATITKELSALLNIYYLRASKAVALNGAVDPTTGAIKTSKKLGTEVDAKVSYKIDRNLTYWVEGGYLFTGSAYDYNSTIATDAKAIKSSDDAYSIRNGIQLSF